MYPPLFYNQLKLIKLIVKSYVWCILISVLIITRSSTSVTANYRDFCTIRRSIIIHFLY